MQSCIVCDKEKVSFCASCRSTTYCSKTCQRNDWKTHKLLCASFSAFDASKRPTADHYRAVFFDPAKEKPEFVWLLCKNVQEEDEADYEMLEIEAIMGGDNMVTYSDVDYNARLKKNLDNMIVIAYRDTFLIDGSLPNKAVKSITAKQPGYCHDWRGPIITHARSGTGRDPLDVKDLDMVDFRHVADYFLSYAPTPPDSPKNPAEQRIKGVRINCLGDERMLKRPHFEAIEIPATHDIFTNHDTSDIAKRIGLPILTQRCPPAPEWINSEDAIFDGHSPFNNQDATFLHQCCDPTSKGDGIMGWGWCPMAWQKPAGSVLVVRQDRKPLHPLHLEALAKYCREEVRPVLAHSIGEYFPEEPITKGHALDIICRPMFVIYWYKLAMERNERASPGPYDEDL